MGCFGDANWKREEIADHKFDYIDVEDFVQDGAWNRIQYSFVFLLTLKSILVYMADIGVLIIMGVSGLFDALLKSPSAVEKECQNSGVSSVCTTLKGDGRKILNSTARIIIVCVSIFVSFVLLAWDWTKAKKVIRSRDISYAFTSTIAYRYYAIRSYPHFCFFNQIQNSRKTVDILAFYVFFVFKDWFRLIVVESPRQFINVLNLRDIYMANRAENASDLFNEFFTTVTKIFNSYTTGNAPRSELLGVGLMIFSLAIWIFSVLNLIVAFLIYIPLLTYIQGNLKEYCVHKIDKRIAELLVRRSRKRREEARKAELAEIERQRLLESTLSDADDSKSTISSVAPPAGHKRGPTLPQMGVDLSFDGPRYGTVPYNVVSTNGPNYVPSHTVSEYGMASERAGHAHQPHTMVTMASYHQLSTPPPHPHTTSEYSAIMTSPRTETGNIISHSPGPFRQYPQATSPQMSLSYTDYAPSTVSAHNNNNHNQINYSAGYGNGNNSFEVPDNRKLYDPESESVASSEMMSITSFPSRVPRMTNRPMNNPPALHKPIPVRPPERHQSTALNSLYSVYNPSYDQSNRSPTIPRTQSPSNLSDIKE